MEVQAPGSTTKTLAPPAPPGSMEKKELAAPVVDEEATGGLDTTTGRATTAQAAQERVAPSKRYIVRSAQIKLQVLSVARSLDALAKLAARFKGFVSDSSMDTEEGSTPSGSVTLRVPADDLDAAVEQILKLGTVLSKAVKGEDITREFVDTAARLRNLRREEDQYLRIMAMAKTVKDVLPVAKELARVRGEVERTQGHLQHMAGLVDLATVTVTLVQKEVTPAPNIWDFGTRWRNAWQSGTENLAYTLGGLVEGLARLMTALPVFLAALGLYILFWWLMGILLVRRMQWLTLRNFTWAWLALGYVLLGFAYPWLFGLLIALGLALLVVWLGHVVYRRFFSRKEE